MSCQSRHLRHRARSRPQDTATGTNWNQLTRSMKSHHRLTFRLLLRFTLSHSARLLLLVLALCLATAAFAFSFVFPFALVLVVAMAFALVFVIAVPVSFLLLVSDPLPALFLIVPFFLSQYQQTIWDLSPLPLPLSFFTLSPFPPLPCLL